MSEWFTLLTSLTHPRVMSRRRKCGNKTNARSREFDDLKTFRVSFWSTLSSSWRFLFHHTANLICIWNLPFFSVEIYIFSFYASLVSSRITSFNDSTTYFRFAPIIGQFKISDIATMSFLLNQVWGRVVKVGGLMGRPDLLFVFDADEIEKVRMECKCV